MTDRHDGGPAFPPMHNPDTHASGMSLRDWFAGQALAGILRDNHTGCANSDRQDQLSRLAYQMADAMLAARRNAACRAACEGIPTKALEAGVVNDTLEALRVARAEIVSQEWGHFNEIAGPGDTFDAWLSDNEALPVIDAAIARATGEKP